MSGLGGTSGAVGTCETSIGDKSQKKLSYALDFLYLRRYANHRYVGLNVRNLFMQGILIMVIVSAFLTSQQLGGTALMPVPSWRKIPN